MEETTETQEEKIIIPTKTVKQEFKIHCKIPNNKRILFSAPFGAGKSFFLTDYFSDNHALAIKLHPIDYSVASNEDIFELMKHDILSALLEKYQDSLALNKEDFSKILMLQEFVKSEMDLTGVGTALLNLILPKGKEISKLLEELKKLNEDSLAFQEKHDKFKLKLIEEFLKSLKNKKGSIRENDAITRLIKEYTGRIKAANEDKPFVLILDDLDRLDPEHLFRLFNVFTAHHDSKTDTNKFNFDQVIFVCDINNIYHMFRHKYGLHVDFSGYIDKFYSSHIFHFEFKEYLKESVDKLIMGKYIDNKLLSILPTSARLIYDFKNHGNAQSWLFFLHEFIGVMIDKDLVKMRNFERFQNYRIPFFEFQYAPGKSKATALYPFFALIENIKQFYPRSYELEAALESLSKPFTSDYDFDKERTYYDNPEIEKTILQFALPFLLEPKSAFDGDRKADNLHFEYPNEHGQLVEIHYNIDYYRVIQFNSVKVSVMEIEKQSNEQESGKSKSIKKSYEVKRPNSYWFLLEAFRNAKKFGYLIE